MFDRLSRLVRLDLLDKYPAHSAVPVATAARIIRRDRKTIYQQVERGALKAHQEDGRWYIRITDLVHYAETRCRSFRRWTKAEIAELKLTGHCSSRSYGASKIKRMRMKQCVHSK